MFYLGDNYKDRFVLPDPNEATAEFSMEDLADDMEGLTPQYPRIKIVSGGANQFDVGTDPENPQLERYLDGVFLFQHPSNAYWQGGNEEMRPFASRSTEKLGLANRAERVFPA